MRGWMNEGKSYVPPVGIGEVMRAIGVGRVEASNNPDLSVGDLVSGLLGVQELAVVHGAGLMGLAPNVAPLPTWLATLGMPGMTAYFGLLDIGRPNQGDTVVVSGRAGAVGSVVGQIAKLKGCRAVGIAGGSGEMPVRHRRARLRRGDRLQGGRRRRGPRGALPGRRRRLLRQRRRRDPRRRPRPARPAARVAICGAISQYNSTDAAKGPANYLSLLVNRARMQGFVVFDYADRYAEAAREMAGWMAAGKLKSREDVVEGLETFPDTLLKLFKGENNGKLILKV